MKRDRDPALVRAHRQTQGWLVLGGMAVIAAAILVVSFVTWLGFVLGVGGLMLWREARDRQLWWAGGSERPRWLPSIAFLWRPRGGAHRAEKPEVQA